MSSIDPTEIPGVINPWSKGTEGEPPLKNPEEAGSILWKWVEHSEPIRQDAEERRLSIHGMRLNTPAPRYDIGLHASRKQTRVSRQLPYGRGVRVFMELTGAAEPAPLLTASSRREEDASGMEKSADPPAASSARHRRGHLGLKRAALAAALASGFLSAGVVLLVQALLDRPVRPNAYLALSATLVGVALIATLFAGLRRGKHRSLEP